jgi:hypothetical protein
VIELLLAALGLGLAGLDPAGALVAAGALAGGARGRHVAAYGLVSLLGTVALGTALSLVVGPRVSAVDWGALATSTGAGLVEVTLGLGLVAWGAARARRPATRAPKPRSPSASPWRDSPCCASAGAYDANPPGATGASPGPAMLPIPFEAAPNRRARRRRRPASRPA